MVLFNYSTKELTAKIVYYGPGLCGKTTNLQFIFDSLPDDKKGRMLSLSTQTDRTLYFDFLPVELGNIRGMKTRMQLYTVPGQVFYNETRKMVLKGVDGVVFVADSQSQMAGANLESFKNLEENLREHGNDLSTIPLVLQYNKRDLPSIQPVEEMNAALNRYNAPFYEAIATTGIGVHDTLKAISKLVLLALSGEKDPARSATATRSQPPPRPAAAPQPPEPGAASWETEGLDEMLDEMDAEEIQGLLEEVDDFGEPAAAAPAGLPEHQVDDTATADHQPAMVHAGTDNETSFATLEPEAAGAPEEHAIWLGEADQEDEAGATMAGEGTEAGSDGDVLEAAFAAHADDREQAPAPDGEDLFATPQAPEEDAFTFESFLAEQRGRDGSTGTPPDPPEPSEWTADAEDTGGSDPLASNEADEPAEIHTGDPLDAAAPRLAPGTPVRNGNGTIKLPLRLQIGARTFACTLTLSLTAEEEADPVELA